MTFVIQELGALRLLILYAHLISCAFALTYVIEADLKIFRSSFTAAWLERRASVISRWLMALWTTGLGLIWIDTGFDPGLLASKSKLLLKLACVIVLTLNGAVLHYISFPVLTRSGPLTVSQTLLLSVTGAVSSSHWLAAAFVGLARPLGQVPTAVLGKAYLFCLGAVILASILSMPVMHRVLADWRLANALMRLRGRPYTVDMA